MDALKKKKHKPAKPVDWTKVQRIEGSGSVVTGHVARQLKKKKASAAEVLMAQLILEISLLREAIINKAL